VTRRRDVSAWLFVVVAVVVAVLVVSAHQRADRRDAAAGRAAADRYVASIEPCLPAALALVDADPTLRAAAAAQHVDVNARSLVAGGDPTLAAVLLRRDRLLAGCGR
jgi:hypothetical protein